MTPTYYAILGRTHPLCLAELAAVLATRTPGATLTFTSPDAALFTAPEALDLAALMNTLGGTIKLGEVRATLPPAELTPDALAEIVDQTRAQSSGKFSFGLSWYATTPTARQRTLGLVVKKTLATRGASVRFAVSRDANLSSAAVEKNHLVGGGRGVELCCIATPAGIAVGTTSVVQPFEAFSQRDYGRPSRDAKSGMLPPKVARMMVNLAQAPLTGILLDPFCGNGTVLQEALLAGHAPLIGSDLSPAAVASTQENLAALTAHQATVAPQLFTANVTTLGTTLPAASVDAIVTEPYLGPALSGREPAARQDGIIRELTTLYHQAFETFATVLRPGGVVVFVFPQINRRSTATPALLTAIEQLGFRRDWGLPTALAKTFGSRGSLAYARPGQRVTREIIRFVLAK